MDYSILLQLCTDLGYRLAMCGAETFRVEESINLIMRTYEINAEAFAIPNNLTVSIKTPDGTPMTRMRRIGPHGNDLDSVEKYTNLSRRICREKPDPKTAQQWLKETDCSLVRYNKVWVLFGNCMGACGFSVFFGGGFVDAIFAALCGLIVGIVNLAMDRFSANQFFKIICASFSMALVAYGLAALGVVQNAGTVIIGTLMILVPGLLFTNAMRDIIYGDTNSGINRIVLVFLVAVAIALGTGAAWGCISLLFGAPEVVSAISHPIWVQLAACFVGCYGFVILFNIHGFGGTLCAIGGMLSWAMFLLVVSLGQGELAGYFFAAALASLYSESMARLRKFPAISYLVISIFPLIPGASIYYTMQEALLNNMDSFASKGMYTIAIAGVIAVGVIMISSLFRMISSYKRNKKQLRM